MTREQIEYQEYRDLCEPVFYMPLSFGAWLAKRTVEAAELETQRAALQKGQGK